MTSAPTPSLLGYRLLGRVGSGAYADVYRASRDSDQLQVALKCVHRSRLNASATDNIVNEIGLLKRLQHPHIVQLYDFACDKHYVYIVMEICAGGDLSRLIRACRRLPESLCRRFLRQLTLAMQYLHNSGISHMDLKPQNLLLTGGTAPVLKVADFGFAQYLSPDGEAGGLRGSPLYMAPEIVMRGRWSAGADLWSIGVILYECLFGKAPYSSGTVDELVNKIKVDRRIELPTSVSISDQCRDLLTKLLERDPEQRISFQQYFQHPFVDLEHAPGLDSLEKGTRVLERAVEHDKAGELRAAADLYMDGVEHLLSAVLYEQSEERRSGLRSRAECYVKRVERLRVRLASQERRAREPAGGEVAADPDVAAIDELRLRVGSVRSALELARSAGWYEREARWDTALEKYQLAIQQLMSRARNTDAEERRLLMSQVERWLSRAETIKSFQELQEDLSGASGSAARDKKCRQQ